MDKLQQQMPGAPLDDDASEAAREAEERRIGALDEIGMALEGWKEEAVKWRGQYEAEWTQDFNQYNHSSSSALPPTKREGSPVSGGDDAAYRQTSDNITRPKVIITAARIGDMLFPTNDANWAIEPTPKPDVPEDRLPPPPPGPPGEDGQPTPGEPYNADTLALAKREYAKRTATKMSIEIKDQLAESHYPEHGRAAIFDGCLYGTGVLYGPVLKTKRRHKFNGGGYQAEMVEQGRPSIEHVDLWSFYPQPCRSIDECEHVFRLHVLPKRSVRALARERGFDSAQIQRLLLETPTHGAIATGAIERGAVRPDAHVVLSDRYTVWQYRGPMPKDAFRAFVVGLAAQGFFKQGQIESIVRELEKDQLNDIDCEVWFSQGIVIKMALSTLNNGHLGYYVFNYEKNPNSIFGHGVPYLCRDDQLATNQLWHAMMLNSMMSAGPQIGVKKGAVMTQDGRQANFTADKPRVWILSDEVEDIKQALSITTIPNVTKDIMGMYERTKANADEHTMTPLIAQGEPTQAVPTSSGTAMLMNAANVVMRRVAKSWDGNITVPLLTEVYDWNMAFNPDDSIKGDYCVVPKGASHLLIKDVMTQHIQFATQLFSTNQILAPYMKGRVFADKNIEMLDLVPADMLYSDEEVAENAKRQGEQPDPEVIKAQAAVAVAEAQKLRAEAEARLTEHKMQWEREEREYAHRERMADIDGRKQIQAMQLEGQRMAIVKDMAQMDSAERVAMQKLIVQLQESGGLLDAKQYDIDSRTRVEAEKIASDEHKLEREIAVEGKDAKVQ